MKLPFLIFLFLCWGLFGRGFLSARSNTSSLGYCEDTCNSHSGVEAGIIVARDELTHTLRSFFSLPRLILVTELFGAHQPMTEMPYDPKRNAAIVKTLKSLLRKSRGINDRREIFPSFGWDGNDRIVNPFKFFARTDLYTHMNRYFSGVNHPVIGNGHDVDWIFSHLKVFDSYVCDAKTLIRYSHLHFKELVTCLALLFHLPQLPLHYRKLILHRARLLANESNGFFHLFQLLVINTGSYENSGNKRNRKKNHRLGPFSGIALIGLSVIIIGNGVILWQAAQLFWGGLLISIGGIGVYYGTSPLLETGPNRENNPKQPDSSQRIDEDFKALVKKPSGFLFSGKGLCVRARLQSGQYP